MPEQRPLHSPAQPVAAFAACLAALLDESASGAVPTPLGDLDRALGHWRSWLAEHGAGLVEVVRPATFAWPGHWIAVLDPARTTGAASVALMFGPPAGVVLCPEDDALLGRAAVELPVVRGFVVAGLEPRLAPRAARIGAHSGRVEQIAVAPAATAAMTSLAEVAATAGRGLAGDRYAERAGTFTPADTALRGYDLTLVAAEVLDATPWDLAATRRNLLTRGIDLDALIGRRFRIGDVECRGRRRAEPCAHLERLPGSAGTLRGLIHRGGLRADVLTDGVISVGDAVVVLD
ncbi:MOSC domain-containing protein [Nocardioides sp.]|uniref:MOSC domain-containing protein n=1 Tax=Nocardioides sp. TaxID=35761 RepID=UPI0035126BE8